MAKKWTKPNLTAIVRGKPEESVLQACKGSNFADGENGYFTNCSLNSDCTGSCFGVSES